MLDSNHGIIHSHFNRIWSPGFPVNSKEETAGKIKAFFFKKKKKKKKEFLYSPYFAHWNYFGFIVIFTGKLLIENACNDARNDHYLYPKTKKL